LIPGTDVAVYDLYGVVAERGSSGPHVEKIQRLLTQQGLPVPITGVFEHKTELAVRAFQEAQGMRETGKLSNAGLRILEQRSILPTFEETVLLPGQTRLPDGTVVTLTPVQDGMSTGQKVALALLFLALLKGGVS
jgi:peptidoglycan hydrolase-like protein with peptidoglycan-binding domain